MPGGGEPDAALVAAVQRDPGGEDGRAAASRLLARYRPRVVAWCRHGLQEGGPDLAQDLAQDVLLSAWTALPRYHEEARFGAWIFTIACNKCRSERRRRRAALAADVPLSSLPDPAPGPDEVLERQLECWHRLDVVAAALDRQEQDALMLRCREGLSVPAITRRMGLTGATGARAVLQRARRKLRAALAAESTPGV